MEKHIRVTLVKAEVKGAWLQDVLDALDIKVSELVAAIDAPHRRTIDKHLVDGSMGINYLYSIKKAYPQVNLNYLIFGELPILLKPMPDIDKLRDALNDIHTKSGEVL